MAVAGDDLGGDGLAFQAELVGDVCLYFRGGGGVCADGAGYGYGANFFLCGDHACFGAFEGGVVSGEFKTEGGGFAVDAVAASDAQGVLMFEAAFFEGSEEFVEVGDDDIGGLGELDGEGCVDDVGAG